jgi:hypothetical protein
MVRLHAEWDRYNVPAVKGDPTGAHIVAYIDTPPSRGEATVRFPGGALVWGYTWQASAKRRKHVILANLAAFQPDGEVVPILPHLLTRIDDAVPGREGTPVVYPAGARPLVHIREGGGLFVGVVGWGGPPRAGESVLEVQCVVLVDEPLDKKAAAR